MFILNLILASIKTCTKHLHLVFLLVIFGCSNNSESLRMEMPDEETVAPTNQQTSDETAERKLIKEGRVEFETENISTARKKIFEAVQKYNGYVSSDQEYKFSDRKSNTVTIRVPHENFDNLLNAVTQGIEKYDKKDIKVKDVTEEFLDIQARLKTKKELEARFLDLLKQAKNVSEVLEIEKHIAPLRAEIESIEGRLKYLQNMVSFSTLTLAFYESIPTKIEFGQKFKNGFMNGWDNLTWFFVALTHIWPFMLIGLGFLVGLKFYKRKK